MSKSTATLVATTDTFQNIRLFRSESIEKGWLECLENVHATVSSESILIRTATTKTILAEIHKSTILSVDLMSADLIRITTSIVLLALKVPDATTCTKIVKYIETVLKLKCIDKTALTSYDDNEMIPNLQDKAVQDYLLKLMFNQNFTSFVDEMEKFMDNLSSRFFDPPV